MCEFDHLFVCSSIGAPEADHLVAYGLREGASNVHPGQGTANRRFFFHNAMLELLWVHDPAEAQSERTYPTHLWERWAGRRAGACPFGMCFRPAHQRVAYPPFSSWEYHPHYLPEPLRINVATNADVLMEPMLFYLASGQRPDNYPMARRQPIQHAIDLREITRVELACPSMPSPSPELQSVINAKLIRLRAGAEYFVELGFDDETNHLRADFRPSLPLIFSW